LTRLFLILALGVFCAPLTSRASGIYRYVEEDGTIVYTNVKPDTSAGSVKKLRKLKGRSFHAAPDHSTETAIPPPRSRMTQAEFDDHVVKSARRYRIPEALVLAVMHTESNFNPGAISPKGASGLMQLMPATARDMYVKDLFDVADNIEGGTRYLRFLANMFDGDMVKMVAAYNAGPDAVKKYGGKVPPYAETQAYVKKVLALYFKYRQQKVAQTEVR